MKCLQVTESESELEESWRELNASAGFEFALLNSLRAAWLPSSSRFKPMTKKGALANLEETLKIRINLRNSKKNISSWMSLRAAWLPFSSRFKLMTKKKRHRILILRFGNNFDIFKGRSIRHLSKSFWTSWWPLQTNQPNQLANGKTRGGSPGRYPKWFNSKLEFRQKLI